MSNFVSVFQHPDQGAKSYSFQSRSLNEERRAGRSMNGNPLFGEFLYSRPVMQVLMATGQRYKLRIGVGALHYRRTDEAVSGKFDYYKLGGSHGNRLTLVVSHKVNVPELGVARDVQISLSFEAARAGQFLDMCAKYVFAVELANGAAFLRGYDSEFANSPAIEIPLAVEG